jgi:hypothetical protein
VGPSIRKGESEASGGPCPALGLRFHGLLGGLALWTLLLLSNGVVDQLTSVLAVAGWLILGLYWIWRAWGQYGAGGSGLRECSRSLVFPILVAGVVVLAWSDLPLRARFETSKAELTDLAHNRARWPDSDDDDVMAGAYRVQSVREVGGGIRLYVGRAYVFDAWGFALLLDGAPLKEESARYEHLEGNWYVFVDRQGS